MVFIVVFHNIMQPLQLSASRAVHLPQKETCVFKKQNLVGERIPGLRYSRDRQMSHGLVGKFYKQSVGAALGFPSLVAVTPTHPGLCYQPQRGATADQRVTGRVKCWARWVT